MLAFVLCFLNYVPGAILSPASPQGQHTKTSIVRPVRSVIVPEGSSSTVSGYLSTRVKNKRMLVDNSSITFRPDHFAIDGCSFKLGFCASIKMGGADGYWLLNNASRMYLTVPPRPGASMAVVTVNGFWNQSSSLFEVRLKQGTTSDGGPHTNDGNDIFHFNHAIPLSGTLPIEIEIYPRVQATFYISSIQVFFAKGVGA